MAKVAAVAAAEAHRLLDRADIQQAQEVLAVWVR
jgi:hypothetical protein